MKHAIKTFIILMLLCESLHSQTAERGIGNQGVKIGDVLTSNKQALGIAGWWRADYGVNNGGSGTNCFAWNSIVGGHVASQYNPTNTPYIIQFGTNFSSQPIPCLNFSTAAGKGANNLANTTMAPFFSGLNKPLTCIIVCNGTSGGTFTATALGWQAATNGSASRIGYRVNSAVATDSVFYHSADTNSTAAQGSLSLGVGNGVWTVHGATYDGNIITMFSNLGPSSTTDLTGQGTTTIDIMCIGGLRNQTTLTQLTNTKIAEVRWYTNSLSGTQYTNECNEINSYYGGFY